MTQKGRLKVSGPHEVSDLRVLDSGMREVAAGTGALERDLDPGIYRVVVQVPGARDEKLVLVQPGQTTAIDGFTLEWDSVAPHQWSRSKHEYQTHPAEQLSTQTHVRVGSDPDARLFVYIRTAGDERPTAPPFQLTNGAGEVLAAFPEVGAHELGNGWIALSVELTAGTYQIEHEEPHLGRRAQAVFVEDGWQTQMFVPWRETPAFARAVTYMRPRNEGFQSNQPWEYSRVEAALQGLADRKVILHPAEVTAFLEGKFENPMLGLIGAYALLVAGDVNYTQLKEVALNLLHLVPHCPDARLLLLVAEGRGATPPPRPEAGWPVFAEPPLFAMGTQYLMDLASRVIEVCPPDSRLACIATSLVTDGMWTRWEPGLQAPATLTRLTNELDMLFRDSPRLAENFFNRLAEDVSSGAVFASQKGQIVPMLKQLVSQGGPHAVRSLRNAGVLDVEGLAERSAQQISIKLAPQLQLPQSVVTAALKQLLLQGATLSESDSQLREIGFLRREIGLLRHQLRQTGSFGQLVGQARNIQEVYRWIELAATSDAPVLIYGESGTGKQLTAKTIHDRSDRAGNPFVALNCAAVPDTLIESELFGHEPGAFMGATQRRFGCLELAGRGTLFLGEVTEMNPTTQAKLLRVLQEASFRRVGGDVEINVDARIIAATNRAPADAVSAGQLREDLFYRLNVFPLALPPLRARSEDIPLLARVFIDEFNRRDNRVRGLTPEAEEALVRYTWPGNVGELRNLIQRAVLLAGGGLLRLEHFPDTLLREATPVRPSHTRLVPRIRELERDLIMRSLRETSHDKRRAAAMLGISLKSLHDKLAKYGISFGST